MNRITKGPQPIDYYKVDLLNASDYDLQEISSTLGLGLSMDELRYIRDNYVIRERKATDVELQTYDQTWSEHCSHKTFGGIIHTPEGTVNGLLNTYFKSLIKELEPEWCYSVFEDNAGIVDLTKDIGIAIKVETHNHPSAIEPFGGAATGIGGVIRDILGVWANPIACTDVLCFGPLDYPYDKLPEGVKHPKYLFGGVVDGIGSYGNSIGIPTVNGATVFHKNYTGNVVVYAGCIGVVPKDQYIRSVKSGDIVLLVGGRTGRDGIHGVTFASAELTKESEEISRPAVQIANPIEEEKIKRALKIVSERKLGSGITDIGGGGLSCGVCETAHRYGLGVEVHLERVPLKAMDMAPWEIWISESQERMLLAVPPSNLDEVISVFENEQVESTILGEYTETSFAVLYFNNFIVGELDLKSLFDPPRVERSTNWIPQIIKEPKIPIPNNLSSVLLSLLKAYNISSKEKVVRRYDQEVKGQTVVKPLQGWKAGPNNAAVLKPLENSWKGIALSSGINSRFGQIHPYWMAASVIDEAVRNNVAVGGRRIALLDNFTWGNPEYEDRLGGLVLASKACYEIGKVYGTPFVSGKDSLYNESPLGPVAPTLLITALGVLPDIRKAVTMDLKKAGDVLYIVGTTKPELGGSEYYALHGELGASVPKLEPKSTARSYSCLTNAIDQKLVRACHDLSEGGLGVSLAEMAFTGDLGVDLNLSNIPSSENMRDDFILFSESNGRLLVEVSEKNCTKFESIMKKSIFAQIGTIREEKRLKITKNNKNMIEISLDSLIDAWKTPLEDPR